MSQHDEPLPPLPEANLREIIENVTDRWLAFLLLTAFGLFCSLAYALWIKPVYEANLLIEIEGRSTLGQDVASLLGSFSGENPASRIEGEMAIVRSRLVVQQAIANTHFARVVMVDNTLPLLGQILSNRFNLRRRAQELRSPFLGLDNYAWGGEHLDIAVLDVSQYLYNVPFLVEKTGENTWEMRSYATDEPLVGNGAYNVEYEFEYLGESGKIMIHDINGRTGVRFRVHIRGIQETYASVINNLESSTPGRGTQSVMNVYFRDTDPEQAATLLNEIGRLYVQQNVNRKAEEAERRLSFLDEQIPKIQKILEASEEELAQYQMAHNSLDLARESEVVLGKSVDIERRRLETQLRIAQLQQRYRSLHPDLRALREQLDAIDRERQSIESEISTLPEAQQQFLRKQRDVEVAMTLYTSLLDSSQRLGLARAGTLGNVRIIDPAQAPTIRKAPRINLILFAGGLVSACLAFLACQYHGRFHGRLSMPKRAEEISGLPVFAIVPNSRKQEEIESRKSRLWHNTEAPPSRVLMLNDPTEPSMEGLRGMRAILPIITKRKQGGLSQVVVVTGCSPGVGKSFVASNLATTLAQSGKSVLLVDCDLRRPALHTCFNVPRQPGLTDYLGGDMAGLGMYIGPIPNLSLVPAGHKTSGPGEVMSSGQMEEWLLKCSEFHELIVIDTPPVLAVSDALHLARLAGVTLLVIRDRQTTRYDIHETLRIMQNVDIRPSGLIYNGLIKRLPGYYDYIYDYREHDS